MISVKPTLQCHELSGTGVEVLSCSSGKFFKGGEFENLWQIKHVHFIGWWSGIMGQRKGFVIILMTVNGDDNGEDLVQEMVPFVTLIMGSIIIVFDMRDLRIMSFHIRLVREKKHLVEIVLI